MVRNGNRRRGLGILWVLFAALLLTGCLGMPPSVTPVQGFDANRYLGKWYEIARLDHSFEEGLDRVTAEYALREDGGITVINRGFLTSDNEWKEAQGKAFFRQSQRRGVFESQLLWAVLWVLHRL